MRSRNTSRTWIPKTSASSLRSQLALAFLAGCLAVAPLAAQGFQVSGQVLSIQVADTVPVAQTWVVLHQVSAGGGGPVDSGLTDDAGSYLLRAPDRDTSAIYLVSVDHGGVNYFGSPIRASSGFTMDTSETVFVYETVTAGPPLAVAEKHMVIRAPDPDGSRPVLELLVIENRTGATRVTADSTVPVWVGALPAGVLALEVGESDFSPQAITRRGDSVALTAPISPGEKQLVYAYTIPADQAVLRIPVDQPVNRFQLLLEDTTATVRSAFLDPRGMEQMDVVRFARYEGAIPVSDVSIEVQFSTAQWSVANLWWIVVTVAGLVLAVAMIRALKQVRTVPVTSDTTVLTARIAELDQRFAAVGDGASLAQRRAYESERATLKARLAAALAEGSRGR